MELISCSRMLVVLLSVFMYVRSERECNDDNCYATNGYICNERGSCDCGTCDCTPPYHGPTCEECPTCPTPCELFKGCVGCKIFGTGLVGIMECITQCDYMANYIPVDKEKFDLPDTDPNITLCKHTNEDYCVESFKIGNMTGGYRDLRVRTEMECLTVPVPTLPPYVEVPVTTTSPELEPSTSTDYTDMDDTTTPRRHVSHHTSTSSSGASNVGQNSVTTTSTTTAAATTTTKHTVSKTDKPKTSTKSTKNSDKHNNKNNVEKDTTNKSKVVKDNTVIHVDVNDPDQPARDSAPEDVDTASGSDNPKSECRPRSDNSVFVTILCVASFIGYVRLL